MCASSEFSSVAARRVTRELLTESFPTSHCTPDRGRISTAHVWIDVGACYQEILETFEDYFFDQVHEISLLHSEVRLKHA